MFLGMKMKFNIRNIDKLESTNSYAQNLLENGDLRHGDVISCYHQENGKGQGENFWESERGSNITISIALQHLVIHPSQQFMITQLVSLALVDVIEQYVTKEDVKIKWPNDIYIADKKIAGILIQNFIKGEEIECSIVGIGVNVNQKEFYSDAPNPVSIVHHSNKKIDLKQFLDQLLDRIDVYYEFHKQMINVQDLKSKYIDKLFRFNIWATYSDGNNNFQGKIIDIDDFGRLVVKMKDGREKIFMFKEIEFVL